MLQLQDRRAIEEREILNQRAKRTKAEKVKKVEGSRGSRRIRDEEHLSTLILKAL